MSSAPTRLTERARWSAFTLAAIGLSSSAGAGTQTALDLVSFALQHRAGDAARDYGPILRGNLVQPALIATVLVASLLPSRRVFSAAAVAAALIFAGAQFRPTLEAAFRAPLLLRSGWWPTDVGALFLAPIATASVARSVAWLRDNYRKAAP